MNLDTLKQDYDFFSGKVSDLTRQFNLAGIAIIWIFRVGAEGGGIPFTKALLWPLGMFSLSIAFDLLHYVSSTVAWGLYFRHKDKQGVPRDQEFRAPRQLNWPALAFFWTKTVLTLIGLALLLNHIITELLK